MRFRRIWGVGFWFASTLLAGGVAAQELMAPRLHAGVLGQTHAVDGRLEEPEWSTAPAVEDFAQTDPREGAAASGKTVVRVQGLTVRPAVSTGGATGSSLPPSTGACAAATGSSSTRTPPGSAWSRPSRSLTG
jgi:hypothetical protein